LSEAFFIDLLRGRSARIRAARSGEAPNGWRKERT